MQTALQTITVHIPAQAILDCGDTKDHLKLIAEVAGGYNLCETYGGWVGKDGKLIHESVTVLTVHLFTASAVTGIEPIIRRLVGDMLNEGNQEAVLADLETAPRYTPWRTSMDTRKFTVAFTKEEAVSPYFVQRKNTENWNTSECFATYAEAHTHLVQMMDEYPTIPWRMLIYRPRRRDA